MSDWKPNADEMEFILSCAPGEACIVYNGVLVKLTRQRIEAIHEVAFKAAVEAACAELGIEKARSLADIDVHPLEIGQGFIRVTVTDSEGRKAEAVGMIPNPEVH